MRRKAEDNNVYRKMITIKNVEVVDGYVKDLAYVAESSDSAIIEAIILDKVLPDSDAGKFYVKSIYTNGLKKTFAAIMQTLAAGVDFQAAYPNGEELIRFAMKIFSFPAERGFDSENIKLLDGYFMGCCTRVCEKIKYETERLELSFDQKQIVEDDILLLSHKITDEADFVPYNFFRLVLTHWDILGNYTYTYRMLYAVSVLSLPMQWEKPEYRLEAREIIAETCREWEFY